jgi:hypothetical protein
LGETSMKRVCPLSVVSCPLLLARCDKSY